LDIDDGHVGDQRKTLGAACKGQVPVPVAAVTVAGGKGARVLDQLEDKCGQIAANKKALIPLALVPTKL